MLAWKGLVDLTGFVPPADALHGLAIGAVGTMTLAVMSRATLGHTGRPLRAPRLIVASYLLLSAAAIVRLVASLAPAQLALPLLVLSGGFWSLAFLAFAIRLGPALVQPRADGHEHPVEDAGTRRRRPSGRGVAAHRWFFAAALTLALAEIPLWTAASADWTPVPRLDSSWHGHEMLFG